MTAIEWTDETWNPTTGCDRVSPGCDNCYALTLAKRLKGMGSAKYQNDGDPKTSGPGFLATEHPHTLTEPFGWRKPRKVFVNSMSDLFHDNFSDEFIARVWAVMAATPQHTYQVLTKRHGRMRSLLSSPSFAELVTTWAWRDGVRPSTPVVQLPAPNVWLGVSVETQEWANRRVPALLETPAAERFISAEPLLGPVDLTRLLPRPNGPFIDALSGDVISRKGEVYAAAPGCVDWVIVGGESGPEHRTIDGEWVRSLRDQTNAAGRAFLFKQWGGHTPKSGGRELDGRTWDEFPVSVGDETHG